MTESNRVTPLGEIVAIEQRGTFLGNRGCIHRDRTIVRAWQVRRWITCRLTFRGWVAPVWEPGRWTPLFFWDEAVALAAGHRPCAMCRRADYRRWLDAWQGATGERPGADAMDATLHAARLDEGRRPRRHRRPWRSLPDGTFVLTGDGPGLVVDGGLLPWRPSPDAYGPPTRRPSRGDAEVLTPSPTVDVLTCGYVPALHPT